MQRKFGVAALSGALLLSGLWVGVSYGGNGGIAEPKLIELNAGHCGGPQTRCRFYGLRTEGKVDGQILTVQGPSTDVDGTAVGRFRETCTYVGGTSNVCTQVFTLKPGPHTERGSIVTTGVLGEWVEGLNGTFAVTGGTGAYVNVRGHAEKVYDGRDFIFTLHLIP
jgi:hypothetical protein